MKEHENAFICILFSIALIFTAIAIIHFYFTHELNEEVRYINNIKTADEIFYKNYTTLKLKSDSFRMISGGRYE